MEGIANILGAGLPLTDAARQLCGALDGAPFGLAVVALDGECLAINSTLDRWADPAASLTRLEHEDPRLQRALTRVALGDSVEIEASEVPALGLLPGAWRLQVSPFNIRGVVSGASILIQDVSETAAAVSAFQASERRFRLLVDSANDGIAVHRGGVVLYVNPSAVSILGYQSASQMIGRRLLSFVHPDYHQMVRERLSQMTHSGSVPPCEEVFLHADGHSVPVEVHASRAPLENGEVTFVFFRDLGERRRLEAERASVNRMESLGRMAGGIAHDFNNLIGAMRAALDTAEASASPEELAAALKDARRAVSRAHDLSRQLLTFSRGGDAAATLVDPNPVIQEAIALSGGSRERIEVVGELKPKVGHIRIAESQLHQVALNLLLNARDALRGAGVVTVATYEVSRPPPGGQLSQRWVVISVSDTGPGLDSETRARLFEPFFSNKPAGVGTGLGLSTVYGIVKKAGGFIEVRGSEDSGTTFDVFFPVQPATSVSRPPKAKSDLSVVVCDDERRLAALTAGLLSQHGFHCSTTNSGAELLRELDTRAQPPDIVLLDVNLPQEDPLDLLAALAKRGHVSVVLTSGYDPEDIPADLLEHPLVVGYLPKPYTVDRLIELCERAALREAPGRLTP